MRSAKYIEGLENRLGRMESLLKLSGLLGREDDDRTDLGTLERRLADKTYGQSNGGTPKKDSVSSSNSGSQPRTLQSPHNTPQLERMPTPIHSPKDQPPKDPPPREKEEAVEELSDMMCSLVTNNCGETRYIGKLYDRFVSAVVIDQFQGHHRASLYFHLKAYNGSTKRPATPPSKTW